MQYLLRNVPPQLDEIIRTQAREQGKDLNEVILEILLVGAGLAGQPIRRRNLSDISGTWSGDLDTDEALLAQRRIDSKLWR